MMLNEVCFKGVIAMSITFTFPRCSTLYFGILFGYFLVFYQIITKSHMFYYLWITYDERMNMVSALIPTFSKISAILNTILTTSSISRILHFSV
ncbi:Uncharacterised protein [Klebsiella pneumoniae]|nr:Uncharacterised protein [Klebsiella pneumoniae]